MKRSIVITALLIAGSGLIVSCSSVSQETPTPSPTASLKTSDSEAERLKKYEEMTGYASPKPKPPGAEIGTSNSGYLDAGNGVKYKFTDGTCDFGSCNFVEIIAKESCPGGVYVEANILDSSSRVIGYTNDLIGSLGAGDVGLATLQYSESSATGIRLTEISCY